MEGALDHELLEHSVRKMHLDSRPGRNELNSRPLEHSVPDHTPRRFDCCQKWTLHLIGNPQVYRESPRSHNGWRAHSGRTSRGPLGLSSAAPWFLTGWAHDVEIEFMIDTGCQVTILSTTVFEHMCVVDPTVRSKLRPCRRRLVSADSSPLMVRGQLELAIVFPGLCCDMLFVVANIGSDGLLGIEALQSYLPHQLDLRMGQLWADGWSTLQLHQQRLTPELDGFLTTSVVIPPDSEIVANFSVSRY